MIRSLPPAAAVAMLVLGGLAALFGGVTGARAQTEIVKSRRLQPEAAEEPIAKLEPPALRRLPADAATAPSDDADGGAAIASDVRVVANGRRTLFEMRLSRPVSLQVFTMANPYRIVVDVPDLDFQLPAGAGQAASNRDGKGLITAFRYGLFAAGRSRIVLDSRGPVRVVRSEVAARPGGGAAFVLELEPTSPEQFAAKAEPTGAAPSAPASKAEPPRKAGKLVVMIDPGHGGIDGGAMSSFHVVEKDIVLAVSQRLKAALEVRGRYDVRMTRSTDVFVALDQRVALSEAAGADLFISIHADSVGDPALARTVHGATIYTLSDTASNQAAQALADKENAADAASGMAASDPAERGQVNTILADLVKRETQNFSMKFRGLLIDRLRSTNMLARDPVRSAAFRVLRQVQTPTVLIELGFLTHETDAQQMQTAEWQRQIALAVAAAVDGYFGKRMAGDR